MVCRLGAVGAQQGHNPRVIELMSQRSTGSLKRAICVENRSQMEDGAEWCL